MITCANKPEVAAKKWRPSAGFTMLELLLVMALMGLMAMIAFPNITGFLDSLSLQHDALQLAQEMRACRTEAIMSQQAQDIRFYPNNDYYEIAPANRVILLSKGIKIKGTTFKNDPHLSMPYCRFRATGAPSQGGHIRLVNRQGKAKYVIVSVAVARIRVADSPPGKTEVQN